MYKSEGSWATNPHCIIPYISVPAHCSAYLVSVKRDLVSVKRAPSQNSPYICNVTVTCIVSLSPYI